MSSRLYVRIGEAARLVGEPATVLRFWEREFGVRPRKGPGGQRLYSERDVERLRDIRRLLHDEGYTIEGARKRLRREPRGDALVELRRRLAALIQELKE